MRFWYYEVGIGHRAFEWHSDDDADKATTRRRWHAQSHRSWASLAKRLNKTEEAPPKPLSNAITSLKHRPSDASQNSRVTALSNVSYKSKNTSPAISSSLASSPPTNASDFDDDGHRIRRF
ncbi:hypothetical protein PG985_015833 [Apiospora marii]|uniref:uncharacterized protein n=1 Tax=Apiospora marii TaxID=335849 RepID=UPI00312F875D